MANQDRTSKESAARLLQRIRTGGKEHPTALIALISAMRANLAKLKPEDIGTTEEEIWAHEKKQHERRAAMRLKELRDRPSNPGRLLELLCEDLKKGSLKPKDIKTTREELDSFKLSHQPKRSMALR